MILLNNDSGIEQQFRTRFFSYKYQLSIIEQKLSNVDFNLVHQDPKSCRTLLCQSICVLQYNGIFIEINID